MRTSLAATALALVVLGGASCDHDQLPSWGPAKIVVQSPAVPPPRPTVVVLSPHPGQVILDDVFDDVAGVFYNMPGGTRLWTFVRDRYGVYMQYPPVACDRSLGTFTQKNVRLATGGLWEILVCVATAEASGRLHQSAQRQEWSFPLLPDGVEVLATVPVERRFRPKILERPPKTQRSEEAR